MKILVSLGHVPDTTTKVKLTDGNSRFDETGVQWVINPWDELALTRALEILEDGSNPVDEVTVITVGDLACEPTIRKALAIGADKGIRVDTPPVDAAQVASLIAEVAQKGSYDLILCGIESSDYNGSAVGSMLAEFMDYPSVSAVSGLRFDAGQVELTRDIDGGHEVVTLPTPFVAIVQKGIAKEPRIPAMRGIMMARKKPLDVLTPAAIEPATMVAGYEMPQPKPPCKKVDPDNVQELVNLLQNEAKVL